jgi:hypothetical protein
VLPHEALVEGERLGVLVLLQANGGSEELRALLDLRVLRARDQLIDRLARLRGLAQLELGGGQALSRVLMAGVASGATARLKRGRASAEAEPRRKSWRADVCLSG